MLDRIIKAYKIWHSILKEIPKLTRYSIGIKIDSLFVELMESVSVASFLQKSDKIPWVKRAIMKLDIIKVMIYILWESKSINNEKYIQFSEQLSEAGKMLGGWNGQLTKQNSPKK